MIPFLKPNIVKKELFLKYLEQIEESRIYSNYGPLNTLFENRIINEFFHGVGSALTVANATVGLMTAISLLKRKGAKYAVMPSFTFAATPLAAMWCGLEPYFIDIKEDNWSADESRINDTIKKLGDKVAIVIPYATFGNNINLSYYTKLHESGVPVVVDAAASFGSSVDGVHFGAGFPGCVIYSFHATKSFGIGEGGLVYSGNDSLISRIRIVGNFGFTETRESIFQGLNSKMCEILAAVGLATLDVYQQKILIRENLYNLYVNEILQKDMLNNGWRLQALEGRVVHQFMPILCPEGESNSEYVNKLEGENIQARTYFNPVCHLQASFKGFRQDNLKATERIANRVMSLPLWEEMTNREIKSVVEILIS